ncbi:hypothetical protein ACHAWO_010433 [Cyclotella atomus]|uniref:DUF7640 domain-containing protein n=1 Tax=Cyclotella atomus TaxID=382360 RepID=A0ABD3NC82_9STRA
MRFIFSAATITSLSPGDPSFSEEHQICNADSASSVVSIRGGVKTQGDECSFVNAFKVQDSLADAGILGCGDGKRGRCVTLKGEVIEAHRHLTACIFANSTPGFKCVGAQACTGADESKIACGSCYGTKSCFRPEVVTIGESSCHNNAAGMYLQANTGYYSCNGDYYCYDLSTNKDYNNCPLPSSSTKRPSPAPTNNPITLAPTKNPISPAPTKEPVSLAPTKKPTSLTQRLTL